MMNSFRISKDNIAGYSFLGFIAVLPFEDIFGSIMLVITIFLALLFNSQKEFFKIFKEKKGLWLLMAYYIIAVISLLYSQDFPESLKKLSKLLAFVLIPIMFLLLNPTEKLLKLGKKIFVFAMIAFSVFSLLNLGYNYIVNYDISHWYNFVQDSMYHKYMPEDAMYLNTALILLLFGDFKKNLKLLTAILFLVIIVLFSVRLGLFIYLLIVTIYFFFNIKSLLNWKTLVIVASTVFTSLLLVSQSRYANDKFYDTLDKIGFNTENQVSEIGAKYHKMGLREKIWSSSIELIEERPILGQGAGVEKRPLAAVNQTKGYDIPPNYHSHNQFLSSILQYGIIGGLWLFFVFLYLFLKLVKAKNLSAFLITVVMLISMITESYLELQQGVFYFCFFISLEAYDSTIRQIKNKTNS